jgi:hypothetical protein
MYIWQEDEKSFACRNGPAYGLRVGRAFFVWLCKHGPEFVLVLNLFAMAYMLSPKVICNLTNMKHVG